MKEAFDHSRGVAAKHRQVAIGAVSKLIAVIVEKMQAARDAAVAMAARTRAWLVVDAAARLICAFGRARLDRDLSDFPAARLDHAVR